MTLLYNMTPFCTICNNTSGFDGGVGVGGTDLQRVAKHGPSQKVFLDTVQRQRPFIMQVAQL